MNRAVYNMAYSDMYDKLNNTVVWEGSRIDFLAINQKKTIYGTVHGTGIFSLPIENIGIVEKNTTESNG